MTPFLSRLVDRAVSATEGSPAVLPVVPPLFAAGPVLDPAAQQGDDLQGERTPVRRGLEADPASLSAPTLSNGNPSVAQDACTMVPVIRLGDRESAAPSAPTLSRFADRVPTPTSVAFPARVPDSPRLVLTGRLQGQGTKVAPGSQTQDVAGRVDVRVGTVIPAPHRTQQDRAVAPEHVPTVRVTIGRIEVRAVTAPPPTQKVPPTVQTKRTAIVLEDYLRSGKAGR